MLHSEGLPEDPEDAAATAANLIGEALTAGDADFIDMATSAKPLIAAGFSALLLDGLAPSRNAYIFGNRCGNWRLSRDICFS
jgi:hypothetical protein